MPVWCGRSTMWMLVPCRPDSGLVLQVYKQGNRTEETVSWGPKILAPCPYSVLQLFLSTKSEAFKTVDLFIKKSKSVLLIKKFLHAWVWNNSALWILALMSSSMRAGWFHVKLPLCRNLVLIKIMHNCYPRCVCSHFSCLINKGASFSLDVYVCVMKSHSNGSKLPPSS